MDRVLLVVDVQVDFVEGGALGVEGGAELAGAVGAYVRAHPGRYARVVASRDTHEPDSPNGGHFATDGDPDYVETWPAHCVLGTTGAEYAPELDLDLVDAHVTKGYGVPAYSAFEGEHHDGAPVPSVLGDPADVALDVVGIATDHCVRATVLDARRHGYAVRVLTDLVAGVAPQPSRLALDAMARAGAELTTSDAPLPLA